MNKVYNSQEDFATNIKNILQEIFPNIRKTQLKIIPYILLGLILSESVVASDIAKNLKNDFSLVQHDSIVKRIRRFFNNKLFHPYVFYDAVIKYIINKFKSSHPDKRVHIIFDHMFSHENYTVFMISMRIGRQGIPLWFRCFKGKSDESAFAESLLKQGIKYVSDLFGNEYDLIFLADRWFNSTSLLHYIACIGRKYCVRLKRNLNVLVLDKQKECETWKSLCDLKHNKYYPTYYGNIKLTDKEFVTNIVISKSVDVAEPWIIATNGEVQRAIKDYGYRFGGIETIFKNQKSNGFYLESTNNASLKCFESMYAIACFGVLFLTILGADYTKNKSCYKNVKIKTHSKRNGVKVRIISLFNTGLLLFNLAFNSSKYIRISYKLILYDI